MNLADVIRVNTLYTRSINLERDGASTGGPHPYIPTTRALQALTRIVETLHARVAPRAWALIGPYGSGKSAFGLFLADLLGGGASVAHKHAIEVLREADGALTKTLKSRLGRANGFCVALVTGSPEPLARRILGALADGAESFLKARGIRVPPVVRALRLASASSKQSVPEILALVEKLQHTLSRAQAGGVLLVIDEAGKFLEYEARHRTAGEAFLLQGLAELACGANSVPLELVVLMHQGFETYARGVGEDLRNEWRKVQGRFETIPYIESSEQVLRVVGSAIVPSLDPALRRAVAKASYELSGTLGKLGALPQTLDPTTASTLFEKCFPLHPVSLLLLPVLCQKVAQSERTLFTYLGSPEPFGLIDRLSVRQADSKWLPWIMPWELYDYFVLNQPGISSDHATHRRWAEVVTALERLGDADEGQTRLLKTIGLLNLVGAQGGLKASERLLELIADGPAATATDHTKLLSSLIEKSIITYRKFNGEYRVWQGSDIDLDDAVRAELERLGHLGLAEILNERKVIEPIVARRYSIEVGTLRAFQPRFVELNELAMVESASMPSLFFCLVEGAEAQRRVRDSLAAVKNPRALAALVQDSGQIREVVSTVLALSRVQSSRSELSNDPIAQRELRDRLAAARVAERESLDRLEEVPESLEWYWRGTRRSVTSKRALQAFLSTVLDHLYPHTPCIANELINRDKPSSAAVAARNKLLTAMLEHAGEADLGIEKYPAEKAIYRSVLRATGIHHPNEDGTWSFGVPHGPVAKTSRIAPLWSEVERFLDGTDGAPRAVSELFRIMQSEPFGLKAGVLPILFLAVCLAYQDEVAVYENATFVPFLGADTIERAIKASESFSIERFRLDGTKQVLLRDLGKAVTGETPANVTLLTVAKPLARFMMGLPEYTKRTNNLSNDAKAVRDLFFVARSPAKLLFRDLPEALTEAAPEDKIGEQFSERVARAFVQLRIAYHALLRDLESMLAKTLLADHRLGLDELRVRLRGRYQGLQDYTIDTQGLKAFIGRLADPYGDESQWLISLGAFLGRKPPEKWCDDDLKAVEYRLADYAKRLRDLERLRLVYEEKRTESGEEVQVVLLKSLVSGKGEAERFVSLTPKIRAAVSTAVNKVRQTFEQLPTDDLRSAALAELFEMIRPREIVEIENEGVRQAWRTAAE